MTSIIPRKRPFNETSAGDSAVPTGNTPDGSNNIIDSANIPFDSTIPFDNANPIETNPTFSLDREIVSADDRSFFRWQHSFFRRNQSYSAEQHSFYQRQHAHV